MFSKKICTLTTAVALMLPCSVSANDIEPGKEFYTAIKTPVPIVIDGNLSEWRAAALLADPRFSIPKASGEGGLTLDNVPEDGGTLVFFEEHNGGTWTGPDDQTSAVQVVYDDDNVYFGFTVTDEYHENSRNNAWNGDSVQLMIANADRDTQIALYNYALGGTEEELGEDTIVNHESRPPVDPEADPIDPELLDTEAVVVRNTETKRTIYEIRLPKASLALETLGGGVRFGLGMAINDGDRKEDGQDGQKGWGGLGAHSIVFGKHPQETALITLATSNDIEPGKEHYTANPAPDTVTLDGMLDEWRGVPVLSDPRFSIPKNSGRDGRLVLFEEHAGGTWSGPDDQTSAVQIAYDADNVYFGFTVTDEYHENSRNNAWNGDSVQLMIANANQDQIIALYNYALGGTEEELGENIIVNHERRPPVDPEADPIDPELLDTEAIVVRNTETKRTIYEIRLPKASLGLESLELGTQFGLGMAINDGDRKEDGQDGQKGWGGLGAHSIVHGKSPEQTALVTLGVGGSSGDLIFLSAINASINTFSFRATDKGESIVDPATAKLTINGEEVSLQASEKRLDATDFSWTRDDVFDPGTSITYLIEIMDTEGNLVTDTGTITTPTFGLLEAPMRATSVDTSKPGFIWRVWQNDLEPINNLQETETALAGELPDPSTGDLLPNLAWDKAEGPVIGDPVEDDSLYKFEIPTVINLNINALEVPPAEHGNFRPDDQMPGLPGEHGTTDGIAAEILTFIEFPEGQLTMGVNSDDGFRVEIGYINDRENVMNVEEFDGGRGAADTLFLLDVRAAGVYPVRVIYFNGGGDANIELFTVKEDNTKVLVNDTENGGLKAYRVGVVPEKPVLPAEFSIGVQLADGNVEITWEVEGLVLQKSSDLDNWSDVSGAVSPYRPSADGPAQFYRLRQ